MDLIIVGVQESEARSQNNPISQSNEI